MNQSLRPSGSSSKLGCDSVFGAPERIETVRKPGSREKKSWRPVTRPALGFRCAYVFLGMPGADEVPKPLNATRNAQNANKATGFIARACKNRGLSRGRFRITPVMVHQKWQRVFTTGESICLLIGNFNLICSFGGFDGRRLRGRFAHPALHFLHILPDCARARVKHERK